MCIYVYVHCRSTVFARRSMQTANWLKHHTELPLTDPYDQPWNINGVFRLTGIRLPNGKYRNKHNILYMKIVIWYFCITENIVATLLVVNCMDIAMETR